jgi:pimeloyl-ACP methyl ester carboxylesterase
MIRRTVWRIRCRAIVDRLFKVLLILSAAAPCALSAEREPAARARFEITLDRELASQPISGSLYLFLTQRVGTPMRGPDWFRPEPFFRLDVQAFKPGETRTIDDRALGFPGRANQLPSGRYRAQAVLDHDFYDPKPADGAGNFYSDVVDVEIADGNSEAGASDSADKSGQQADGSGTTFRLHLTNTVKPTEFPESKRDKEIVLQSRSLERFHKREVIERAAVVLPPSYYEEQDRRYPTVYIIPGFGGSHRDGLRSAAATPQTEKQETEFIRVYLSGRCRWGHHVYADSATNGPRGEALVREMIPLIDREFRTVAGPTARFVMGHSSGGWSSLWLQVTYPDTFGGVWSSSPDPVDFRDYQRINLYADPPQNMYRDEKGERRPIARRGETPVLWYDEFTRMDDVIGRGGQLRSFEAVFSPLDAAGLPKRLWNRETGEVDPAVAKAWQRYDISLILARDWQRLKPLLAGKLHVTMGTLDTFYLDGATRLLADRLKELGSDAKITFVEGASHGSLLTPDYYARVRQEMSAAYWKHHADRNTR